AQTAAALLVLDRLERRSLAEWHVVRQRPLALEQTPRHIARHGADDFRNLVALGQHGAAVARILHETILAFVAAHLDMGDNVDPEPRGLAPADATVEQLDLFRNVRKQGIERLAEQLQPR